MSNLTGIYQALVFDLSDPANGGRARLLVPSVLGKSPSGWATPVQVETPGDLNSTKVNDRAWVFFEDGDINRPTWLAAKKPETRPTGVIEMYAGSTLPAGLWHFCDGGELPIVLNLRLYVVLTDGGTVFPWGANTNGSGAAGTTHFRKPDFRARSPIGTGVLSPDPGYGYTFPLGTKYGEQRHAISIAEMAVHNHGGGTTTESNFHTHPNSNELTGWYSWTLTGAGGAGYLTQAAGNFSTGNNAQLHTHQIPSQGSGSAHENMHPVLGVNFIIKG